jgi:hypothetical protein
MAKSKSMTGKDGDRKLAAGHGRAKSKSGGEPKKKSTETSAGMSKASKKSKG